MLKEYIEELVKESLRGFSISKFKAISDNAERKPEDPGYGEDDIPGYDNVLMAPEIDYAERYLPMLGEGSSRIVFALSSGKVLKIALNKAGEGQNGEEAEVWFKSRSPYITQVYDFSKNNKWIISEIVKPITEEDVERILEIDKFVFLMFLAQQPAKLEDIHYVFQTKINYSEDVIETKKAELEWSDSADENTKAKLQSDIEFEEEQANIYRNAISNKVFTEFMSGIINLVNTYSLQWNDINKNHFGRNVQGQIKLLDFGYSTNVANDHYSYELS